MLQKSNTAIQFFIDIKRMHKRIKRSIRLWYIIESIVFFLILIEKTKVVIHMRKEFIKEHTPKKYKEFSACHHLLFC